MPAVSKSQQALMGMAHAEQQGKSTGSAAARRVARTTAPGTVEDFAATPTGGLPQKKAEQEDISVRPPDVDQGVSEKVPDFDAPGGPPEEGDTPIKDAAVPWDQLHTLDQAYLLGVKRAADESGVSLSTLIGPRMAWEVYRANLGVA